MFLPRKKIITSPFRQRGNIVGFVDPNPPPPVPPADALEYVLKLSANNPEPITGGGVRYDWFFKPDGTKAYTWRNGSIASNSFREYDVAVPWSIQNADWSSVANVLIGGSNARTFQWSPDGTKLLTLQRWFSSNYRLINYNQSDEAWTIANGLGSGGAGTVGTNIHTGAFTVRWRPDGLIVFVEHSAGLIDAQTVAVAFDASTLVTTPLYTFDSQVDAGARAANIAFSDDGTKLYSITNTNFLCSWELTAPYDLSAPFNFSVGVSVILPTPLQIPRGLIYRPDNGDLLAERDQSSQNVRCWEVPKPDPDITEYTLTTANPVEIVLIANNHHSPYFNIAGDRVYFGRGSAWQSLQYTMSTPGDLSTMAFETNLDFGFVSQFQRGITMNQARTKFYHIRKVSATNDFLVSADPFSTSAAGDPGQNPYLLTNVQTFFFAGNPVTPTFSLVSTNDQDWFILERAPTEQIHHYQMGTPGDASTASYQGVALDLSSKFSVTVWTHAYTPDGTKLFVLGDDGGGLKIVQYDLSTPYDINTAVDASKEIAVSPAFTINLSMQVWENPLGGFRLVLTYMDDINQPGLRYDQYDAP